LLAILLVIDRLEGLPDKAAAGDGLMTFLFIFIFAFGIPPPISPPNTLPLLLKVSIYCEVFRFINILFVLFLNWRSNSWPLILMPSSRFMGGFFSENILDTIPV